MQLTWSAQLNEFGRKVTQRLGKLGSLLNPSSFLYPTTKDSALFQNQLVRLVILFVLLSEDVLLKNTWKIKSVELKRLSIVTGAQ